jgi:hypothetical protein
MKDQWYREDGSFGGGVYGTTVPLASTTTEELKSIANNIQLSFSILNIHGRSLNGFEANQTTQWHSSPSDVIHFANFQARKKVRTVFERHVV